MATAPICARFIERLALAPKSARGAVAFVAMMAFYLDRALNMIFGGLLVQVLARREDLCMDFRAEALVATGRSN